jgi:polyhydroxyalkanoate synthesis repressor PhaR
MSDTPRIIKKYPNRRLYDTANSGYITLVDVKQMVLDNIEFQVIDAKTGEALTRLILRRSSWRRGRRHPMFSSEMLTQMIRFYGSAQQTIMGSYIEQSVKASRHPEEAAGPGEQIYGDKMMITPDLWKRFVRCRRRRCGDARQLSEQSASCSWTCSSGCRTRRAGIFAAFRFPFQCDATIPA